VEKGYRLVDCQRLFGSRLGSQYSEVQPPSQDQEGPSTVPVDAGACERFVGTVFQLPSPDAIYSRDEGKG
jgi:hypothetical protein